MRTKHPPSPRLGGTIGLCVALAALSGCAASEAGSPVAGSAAPMATPAPEAAAAGDRADDARPTPGQEPAEAADVSGRLGAPGSSDLDGGRGDVEQQPVAESDPATAIAVTSAGGPSEAGTTSGQGADDRSHSGPTQDSGAATPTATTDGPGRTSRGGHSGRPGTPPTTAAIRRPGTTTSVVTTSTVAPVTPPPAAQPPTTDPPADPPTPSIAPPAPEPVTVPASDAVALVNAVRTAAGLSPLIETEALHAAAQAHSLDQASMQSMTHIGSDGADAGVRIARSGFEASAWAENLAAGYGAVEAAIEGWMTPDGQDRTNVLDPAFTAIGLASAEAGDGTVYWTMLLAG